MDKLSRVISIMIDLINNEIVDTVYLASKYEVSTRTIYRDIDLLDRSGIPIVSKQGKQGGFSIMEGFKIDKNILSENEFSIVLRGLQALANNKDREAVAVFDKLVSILNNNKKEKIIKTSQNVIIDISPLEEKKEIDDIYNKINYAIENRKCLEIKYYSVDKGTSKRIIEPLILIFKSSNWYLQAFCRDKKDFRNFKLLRIKELKILEDTFEEKDFSINEMKNFFNGMDCTKIVIKTDKNYASFIEENYGIFQKEEKGKDIFLTLKYPLNNWVYSTLLSFGDNVEVVSPKEIRTKLIGLIKNMNKKYD